MALKISSSARNPKRRTSREGSGKSRLPLILIVGGVLLVIILAFFFLRPGSKQLDQDRLRPLEVRILQMERKMAGIERLDARVSKLEEDFKNYAIKMMDRVDSIEKSLALTRQQISAVSGSEAGKKPPKGAATGVSPRPTAPASAAEERFHTVLPGDTLFRISRRYGLTVDELRRLNDLDKGAVIHPGQKLRVFKSK